MITDIVDYMKDEGIEVNETNYKLEVLNFIAENTLNGLPVETYIQESIRLLEGQGDSSATRHKGVRYDYQFTNSL